MCIQEKASFSEIRGTSKHCYLPVRLTSALPASEADKTAEPQIGLNVEALLGYFLPKSVRPSLHPSVTRANMDPALYGTEGPHRWPSYTSLLYCSAPPQQPSEVSNIDAWANWYFVFLNLQHKRQRGIL